MKLHGSRRTFGRWTCTAGHVEWDDCEWCLGFSRWSPVKSWKAWDSTRIHEILIPWCIKMYQDVPRCWWRLIYLKTIEHYLYQYLYEWNGHWNSKKSCDVFCHIHELNCTVLLGNLVACFPELSFPYLMTILASLLGCFENWATCRSCLFGCCFASLFESMKLQVLYTTTYIILYDYHKYKY